MDSLLFYAQDWLLNTGFGIYLLVYNWMMWHPDLLNYQGQMSKIYEKPIKHNSLKKEISFFLFTVLVACVHYNGSSRTNVIVSHTKWSRRKQNAASVSNNLELILL